MICGSYNCNQVALKEVEEEKPSLLFFPDFNNSQPVNSKLAHPNWCREGAVDGMEAGRGRSEEARIASR